MAEPGEGRARGGARGVKGARAGPEEEGGEGRGGRGERGRGGGARGERARGGARWGKEFSPARPRVDLARCARARWVWTQGPAHRAGRWRRPPGSARASAEGSVCYPPVPAMGERPHRGESGRRLACSGRVPSSGDVGTADGRRRRRSLFFCLLDAKASALTSRARGPRCRGVRADGRRRPWCECVHSYVSTCTGYNTREVQSAR